MAQQTYIARKGADADFAALTATSISTAALTTTGAITQTGATQFSNTVTVGVNDTGYDVKMFGATNGKYWLWDESGDTMTVQGTAGFFGQLTVGQNDTGHDVIFYGATAGKYMQWDESADKLIIAGSADLGDTCEANAYTVGGVAGVDFGPAAPSSITVVKGIVTAASS